MRLRCIKDVTVVAGRTRSLAFKVGGDYEAEETLLQNGPRLTAIADDGVPYTVGGHGTPDGWFDLYFTR